MTEDSYRRSGLRSNPFATHLDDGDYLERGAGAGPAPGRRAFVQVIGDKGAGKTTTLMHWRAQQPGPYHHVAPGGPLRWASPPIAEVAYWDELDRLPGPVRRMAMARAARAGATVVAGTHDDLAALARRAGFTVTTVRYGDIGVTELEQWARGRIDRVRLPGHPPLVVPGDVLAHVSTAAGPSWRAAADLLHAWVADHVAALPPLASRQ